MINDLNPQIYNKRVAKTQLFDNQLPVACQHARHPAFNFLLKLIWLLKGTQQRYCYLHTFLTLHLWAFAGKIPPNSVLKFDVLLDHMWVNPFKFDTTFLPAECGRKTHPGDFIRIHYNGTLDDQNKTTFWNTYVLAALQHSPSYSI